MDGLYSLRFDEKDCWFRYWGSGSSWDCVVRFVRSVGLLVRWVDASGDWG